MNWIAGHFPAEDEFKPDSEDEGGNSSDGSSGVDENEITASEADSEPATPKVNISVLPGFQRVWDDMRRRSCLVFFVLSKLREVYSPMHAFVLTVSQQHGCN